MMSHIIVKFPQQNGIGRHLSSGPRGRHGETAISFSLEAGCRSCRVEVIWIPTIVGINVMSRELRNDLYLSCPGGVNIFTDTYIPITTIFYTVVNDGDLGAIIHRVGIAKPGRIGDRLCGITAVDGVPLRHKGHGLVYGVSIDITGTQTGSHLCTTGIVGIPSLEGHTGIAYRGNGLSDPGEAITALYSAFCVKKRIFLSRKVKQTTVGINHYLVGICGHSLRGMIQTQQAQHHQKYRCTSLYRFHGTLLTLCVYCTKNTDRFQYHSRFTYKRQVFLLL